MTYQGGGGRGQAKDPARVPGGKAHETLSVTPWRCLQLFPTNMFPMCDTLQSYSKIQTLSFKIQAGEHMGEGVRLCECSRLRVGERSLCFVSVPSQLYLTASCQSPEDIAS